MAIDFLVAILSIGFVGVLWRIGGPLDIGLWKAFTIAIFLALLFGLFNTILGLKVVAWSHAAAEDALRLIASCTLVTLTIVAIQLFVLPEPFLPVRFMIDSGFLCPYAIASVSLPACRVAGSPYAKATMARVSACW
jgi:FlaA1/EpsC-like NDP-sugar epimerase